MKHTKYLLPTLIIAAGCLLYSYADNSDMMKKMKPENRPATEARVYTAPAETQRLTAAEDGAPYGLHVVDIYNKDVTLRWNNPEATNGYFDDFEAHPDFAINSPGNIGWSFLDMDNEDTYTWTAASFPTQGQKMAYVIMNPAATTPSVADWPAIQPYSGTKMLVAFTVDGGNNDYMISPELNFEENFQVSFRAKSYTDAYGLERFRVGYSTTGKQASNFTYVNPGEYVEVPAEWTLFKYDIPKEAKYVTINCVSFEAFMLLIDDVFVGTNRVRPKAPAQNYLKGFNLYRNDVKVNDELIEDICYTDVVEEYGFYNYTISAVYSDGSEIVQQETLTVEVPDIRLLPFEDGFDQNVLEPDNWSTPVDEQGNPSKWSSSYYPYGLVDYSAQYVYSSLKDYSQSLVSKELRTVN
ncbi:MAG: choice-of-anchor J domain-containing protein, partial [Bacteroidaceae bacterium]|nr:choice-of-anchor J domain-containing protein [Bacteroidaceae bacterium]